MSSYWTVTFKLTWLIGSRLCSGTMSINVGEATSALAIARATTAIEPFRCTIDDVFVEQAP